MFLEAEKERSLSGCRHCRFHEYGKQSRFGRLRKEKVGGIEFTSMELEIL